MEQIAFFLMYVGQACFVLQAGQTTIVIDPAPLKMGYIKTPIPADVVTISHEHSDHNALEAVAGKPTVLRGLASGGGDWAPVNFSNKDVKISAFPAYHDDQKGAQRGRDTMFLYEVGGLRILHVGDLGHQLSDADVKKIGRVDVLLICVGGYYTIDAPGATSVIRALKPRVAVPMHFKTDHTSSLPITGVDDFLKEWKNVRRSKEARVGFSPKLAGYPEGETTILMLPPSVDVTTTATAKAKP